MDRIRRCLHSRTQLKTGICRLTSGFHQVSGSLGRVACAILIANPDTNNLGYFVSNSSAALQKRMLAALKKQEVAISATTRAETRFGLALLQAEDKRRRTIDLLLNVIPVLPWTVEAADRYGDIAAHLQQTGQPIGEMDTQIAAHALALNLPLVTHNTRHFKRVAGLKLEDWMT